MLQEITPGERDNKYLQHTKSNSKNTGKAKDHGTEEYGCFLLRTLAVW